MLENYTVKTTFSHVSPGHTFAMSNAVYKKVSSSCAHLASNPQSLTSMTGDMEVYIYKDDTAKPVLNVNLINSHNLDRLTDLEGLEDMLE